MPRLGHGGGEAKSRRLGPVLVLTQLAPLSVVCLPTQRSPAQAWVPLVQASALILGLTGGLASLWTGRRASVRPSGAVLVSGKIRGVTCSS